MKKLIIFIALLFFVSISANSSGYPDKKDKKATKTELKSEKEKTKSNNDKNEKNNCATCKDLSTCKDAKIKNK